MSLLIAFKLGFLIGGLTSLFLAVFIYFQNRKETINRLYAGLSACSAIWSLGFLGMISTSFRDAAVFWRWFMEAGSIFIPAFWFHFVFTFLSLNKKPERAMEIGIIYLASFMLWVMNATDLFDFGLFTNEMVKKSIFNFYPVAGIGYYTFFFFFFLVVIYSLYFLLREYGKSNQLRARQIGSLILGALLGFGGGGMTFLLTLNIDIIPLGVLLFAFYPIAVAYAMAQYQLFNVKVIVTELLAFIIWIFVLARTYIAETFQERVINGGLLIFLMISGWLLIKSVIKEIRQRERIEQLAKELEKANERLKELDQLKNEFVSLATHQIRGPLTAIKGYASMMRDGDYGEVPARIKGTVDIIFESSNALTTVVQDFLDISRIEQGRMKYELTVFDFSKLVQSVGEELAPVGERRGLRVKLEIEPNIIVEADTGKMRQIIGNLIDNAIKYTSRGHIIVSLKKSGANARLEVKDTGVGIRPETLPKLFQKFSRAEDASKANVLGTGLGLYAAKKLLEAQSGTIWAESEGEEKGSTFSVELPSV